MSVVLDFNATQTKREAFSNALVARIDAALEQEADTPRAYIGASAIGDECLRRVQLDVWPAFHEGQPQQPPHSGRTKRIFARGHRLENTVADWLRMAGLDLATVDTKTGYAFGFKAAQGQLRGHVDGVIRQGLDQNPAVWENKVLGAKGWREVSRHGLAKAYPKYADQIALYQAYLDLVSPALFTALNADTMEIWAELVPFDQARAQAASDRAVKVLQSTRAGELLPRAASDPDSFPCAYCRYRPRCFEGA